MLYRSEGGLYQALEDVLKNTTEPMTCVQIFDLSKEVRDLALTPNRVSDYLGGMWRKGQVTRGAAPKINNSSARWAYAWRQQPTAKPGLQLVNPAADPELAYSKAGVEIIDRGNTVIIELPGYAITIRKK